MSSKTVSSQARERARTILKELAIDHAKGEEIIGEALEEWADAGYRVGQEKKFNEVLKGFLGGIVALQCAEGRTAEEAMHFIEEILVELRQVPDALSALASRMTEVGEEIAEDAAVERVVRAVRPSSPPKDDPS